MTKLPINCNGSEVYLDRLIDSISSVAYACGAGLMSNASRSLRIANSLLELQLLSYHCLGLQAILIRYGNMARGQNLQGLSTICLHHVLVYTLITEILL
jgi:hypothetical protein